MKIHNFLILPVMIFFLQLPASYGKNDSEKISETDVGNLLFMLEEEKLARDTYDYLNQLYNTNRFANILQSEQRHMDAIAGLLDSYNIEYTILPAGKFSDAGLQNYYDMFVEEGKKGIVEAYTIGATIEDVDIYDLKARMAVITNESVLSVFEKLKCGSENHMRSFCSALSNSGVDYIAQYISAEELKEILAETNSGCGNGKKKR